MIKRYATNLALSSALLAVCCTAFAAPAIPAQFRGIWTAPSECPVYKQSGATDTGVSVTPTGVQQYETYCELKKVVHTDASTFAGRFTCNVEGATSTETIKLTLAGGQLRYNGAAALSPCR